MTISIDRNEPANLTRVRYNDWYDDDHYYYLDSEPAQILYKSVAEIVHKNECSSLLDVGCHHGNLVPYLDEKLVKKYVGIDISDQAIENARSKFGQRKSIKFCQEEWSNFDKIKKFDEFDALYFGGVFFYIPEPKIEFIYQFL